MYRSGVELPICLLSSKKNCHNEFKIHDFLPEIIIMCACLLLNNVSLANDGLFLKSFSVQYLLCTLLSLIAYSIWIALEEIPPLIHIIKDAIQIIIRTLWWKLIEWVNGRAGVDVQSLWVFSWPGTESHCALTRSICAGQ